jgi:hypothetical protein
MLAASQISLGSLWTFTNKDAYCRTVTSFVLFTFIIDFDCKMDVQVNNPIGLISGLIHI